MKLKLIILEMTGNFSLTFRSGRFNRRIVGYWDDNEDSTGWYEMAGGSFLAGTRWLAEVFRLIRDGWQKFPAGTRWLAEILLSSRRDQNPEGWREATVSAKLDVCLEELLDGE
jgi:hypothetical protein